MPIKPPDNEQYNDAPPYY